ncbi:MULTISPECIES: hypothetical protein [unclassified Streptomyces]|nr:hypothetical protein OG395_09460 [Streptomyces sp. NBC_01320]
MGTCHRMVAGAHGSPVSCEQGASRRVIDSSIKQACVSQAVYRFSSYA